MGQVESVVDQLSAQLGGVHSPACREEEAEDRGSTVPSLVRTQPAVAGGD